MNFNGKIISGPIYFNKLHIKLKTSWLPYSSGSNTHYAYLTWRKHLVLYFLNKISCTDMNVTPWLVFNMTKLQYQSLPYIRWAHFSPELLLPIEFPLIMSYMYLSERNLCFILYYSGFTSLIDRDHNVTIRLVHFPRKF